MKTVIAIFFLSLLCAAQGQDLLSSLPRPTRSQSGEFLAFAVPGTSGAVSHSFFLSTNRSLIALEPWVLVVSCERIKDALWTELNVTTPARAKIALFLYRAESPNDPITITPRLFADGWNYRVDLPDLITQTHYLSAMTHVMLLELANRNAYTRSTEIPLWLREGLAQHTLASRPMELIPVVPQWNENGVTISRIVAEGRMLNPLTRTHEVLTATPPLTFGELSWPTGSDMQGEPGEQFRSSAQLFTARLLALKNGHNLMRTMVETLPEYYNWQFALLKAYNTQFASPLDIEKWWAMNVVQFTGHDLSHTWPAEDSLRRLEAAIRPQVEVRTATNQMPLHTDATLQTIINDWKKSQRDDTLQQIVNQLAMLKVRLAPSVAMVADSYQNALTTYLRDRQQFDRISESKRRSSITEALVTRSILKTLDELDARRMALRPRPKRSIPGNPSASLDTNGNKLIVP